MAEKSNTNEDEEENPEDYDLEDFIRHKGAVVNYIRGKNGNVEPATVLGHFLLPPKLYDKIEFIINMVHSEQSQS